MNQNAWRTKLIALNNSYPSRRVRRMIVGLYLAFPVLTYVNAIIAMFPWRDSDRLYSAGACISSLTAVLLGALWMRFARRAISLVSRDDQARMQYGKSFDELTEMQKDRVKWQIREQFKGGRVDERERTLQREAEGHAFRIVKAGLILFIAAYWVVCECLPMGPVRLGMLVSAVTFSGVVILASVLPVVIRGWAEPADAPEPQILERES